MQTRTISNSMLALALFAASGIMATANAASHSSDEATMTMSDKDENHVLASGSWTKKKFKSSGTWSIYEQGGKSFVKLSSDFKTRKAPDLKIFLSPLAAADTNGKNATDGSVMVSPLTANSGEQVYEIPEGVNIANYQSILIHCEAYSKLWSAADL